MSEFWYDYVKSKYGKNAKLCYMDTDRFIVHVKTHYIKEDIAKDLETRFDTSNFEIDKTLPKGKNKKVIGLMKGELGGKIIEKIVRLTTRTYNYLKDNNDEDKNTKGTKNCTVKRLKF